MSKFPKPRDEVLRIPGIKLRRRRLHGRRLVLFHVLDTFDLPSNLRGRADDLSRDAACWRLCQHRDASQRFLASRPLEGVSVGYFFTVRDRQLGGERPRIEVIGMGGAWQNLAVVRGLEATNGYNPLRIGLYDRLISPGESNWRVDLRELRRTLGPRIALQGHVDPAVLFAPPDTIRKVTQETLATLGGVGHVLNLGHGILQDTPVENAKIFIETAQSASLATTQSPRTRVEELTS